MTEYTQQYQSSGSYASPYSSDESTQYAPPSTDASITDDGSAYTPTGDGSDFAGSQYAEQYSEPVLTTTDEPADDDSSSAKDRATESAQAGKQAASEVAGTAADKAKDVAAQTKQQAKNVLGQAQDQLQEQTKTQQANLVTNLRSLGDQLGSMSSSADQQGPATGLVGDAGDRLHSAASWLENRDASEILDEARRFAARKPAAFLLGALAAGVVAGRLTRGLVAVHKDDDAGDAVDAPVASAPVDAYPAVGYTDTGALISPEYADTADGGYAAGGYPAATAGSGIEP